VYVNDAFGEVHRADASTVGVPRYLPAYAGLRLEQELSILGDLLRKPRKPFVAIVGGAKIEDKLGTVRALLKRCDALLLGGALANTVLLAKGIQVGRSRIDRAGLKLLKNLDLTDTRIHIPVDVVVANGKRRPWHASTAPVGRVPRGGYIYDIGPDTVALYRSIIARAGTVLWGGPMGYFEEPRFRRGTRAIARAVAESRARSIIGGGDTLNAARIAGVLDHLSHVSIGGGAMLELLAGNPLPSIKPLTIRSSAHLIHQLLTERP